MCTGPVLKPRSSNRRQLPGDCLDTILLMKSEIVDIAQKTDNPDDRVHSQAGTGTNDIVSLAVLRLTVVTIMRPAFVFVVHNGPEYG